MMDQGNSAGSRTAEKVTPASEYAAAPTPTPWDYVPSTEHHGPFITSSVGGTIADLYLMTHPSEPSTASGGRSRPVSFYHEMADPNAALIVRAVNAHDALVKALTDIIEANKDFCDGMPQNWDGDPLQDACDAAAKLLASVQASEVSDDR